MTKNSFVAEETLKTRHFERELWKSSKKANFLFSFEPSPFSWTRS